MAVHLQARKGTFAGKDAKVEEKLEMTERLHNAKLSTPN